MKMGFGCKDGPHIIYDPREKKPQEQDRGRHRRPRPAPGGRSMSRNPRGSPGGDAYKPTSMGWYPLRSESSFKEADTKATLFRLHGPSHHLLQNDGGTVLEQNKLPLTRC